MRIQPVLIAAVMTSVCSTPAQARETLATPVPVEVTLRSDQRLGGKLAAYEESGFTLHIGDKERVIRWDELVPVSAFGVKFRLIDKENASDWLELGRWGWEHGVAQQAQAALANARRLEKSLGAEIDAILAQPAGAAIATPSVLDPTTKPADGVPPLTEETSVLQPGYRPEQQVIRYTAPTAEQNAAQVERARRRAAEAERLVETKFVEVETQHFLIFTDWDSREHGFLKQQCEGAYAVLARQFQQPLDGSVFEGKLPIFMFATQKAFLRFAHEFDEFRASETVLGYFFSSPTEQGHMAMWKPGIGTGIGAGGSREEAMRKWGRTLIHEFAHAFIHRYKSNARVPRWLNEGTAEMISEAALPTNNYRAKARIAAQENVDVMPLFDDSNMPGGEYYPVMMTLAECLQKQGSGKFIALFNEIKEGTDPEEALRKVYGIDHLALARGWNRYARGLK